MTTIEEERDLWNTIEDVEMDNVINDNGDDKNAPQNAADRINHPSHYTQGGVECIEGIKAALGDGFVDYCQGNAIKYLWRWRHKGGVEDLRKAQVYLGWMIAAVDGSQK